MRHYPLIIRPQEGRFWPGMTPRFLLDLNLMPMQLLMTKTGLLRTIRNIREEPPLVVDSERNSKQPPEASSPTSFIYNDWSGTFLAL